MTDDKQIKIDFIADKIPAFYIYLLEKGYFAQLPVVKDNVFFKSLKKLQENLNQRKIQTHEELYRFVHDSFLNKIQEKEKTTHINEFQSHFQAYSQFYDKNKISVEAYVQALNDTQKSYAERLKQMYSFLKIKPEFKCSGIVTPVPFKDIDGAGNPQGFYILFTPEKKKDEVYIGDSLLPERKQYTPLHEAGHVLYANSGVRRDLAEQKGLGARKLILTLSKYFFENPNKRLNKNMIPAWNALACVDEAVAVFSASISSDKVGYYGWEAADILSKEFYPIAARYLQENKPMDDNLYKALAVAFERKVYQNKVQKPISKLQSER